MKKIFQRKKSERGSALIESIPVLFTLVVVLNFSFGFFGAIHSGILNSIAAYNYTLETFRFRANLIYFRPGGAYTNYKNSMARVHGIIQDGNTVNEQKDKWPVTVRSIAFANNVKGVAESDHSFLAFKPKGDAIWNADSTYVPDSFSIATPEIWLKTIYGICLNADCKKK